MGCAQVGRHGYGMWGCGETWVIILGCEGVGYEERDMGWQTCTHPDPDSCYRHQIKEAGKTKNNPSIKLDHTPINKPKKETKVPKQLDKRARGDREMVLDLIFSSFQTHEFYNFKDLVHKTAQPPVSPPCVCACMHGMPREQSPLSGGVQ